MSSLYEIAKTYGFHYEETEQGKEKVKFLLARDDTGKWIPWIRLNQSGSIVIYGDTGNCNLWFYDTRTDLTPDTIVEFVRDLSELVNKPIPVRLLIDPEDLQEIADIKDANKDPRYTGNVLKNKITAGRRRARS